MKTAFVAFLMFSVLSISIFTQSASAKTISEVWHCKELNNKLGRDNGHGRAFMLRADQIAAGSTYYRGLVNEKSKYGPDVALVGKHFAVFEKYLSHANGLEMKVNTSTGGSVEVSIAFNSIMRAYIGLMSANSLKVGAQILNETIAISCHR